MPYAPSPRLADPAPADQTSLLHRSLRRWLGTEMQNARRTIAKSAEQCQADRYRKHFGSFAHASLLIFHGLSANPSLRQSHAAFAACPGLVQVSGLAPRPHARSGLGVSFSDFAAANTTRPAAFMAGLAEDLISRVRQLERPGLSALPQDLRVLDSTVLRLSMRLAPWLCGLDGVRIQCQYAPALDLPEHIVITNRRTNDVQGLDQLILDAPERLAGLADQTLVIDLGYYSHARLKRLVKAGVHFVTRRHPQASIRIEEALPVQQPLSGLPQARIRVLRDERISLGSPNNRAGSVINGLRMVSAKVLPLPKAASQGAAEREYQVLTDRWDLAAADVVQLYLWRWQIELFFRWLKSHVRMGRLLGYSRNAVELTVWLGVIVHLLAVLAAHALERRRPSAALLCQLRWVLPQITPQSCTGPDPPATQLAFHDWTPNT